MKGNDEDGPPPPPAPSAHLTPVAATPPSYYNSVKEGRSSTVRKRQKREKRPKRLSSGKNNRTFTTATSTATATATNPPPAASIKTKAPLLRVPGSSGPRVLGSSDPRLARSLDLGSLRLDLCRRQRIGNIGGGQLGFIDEYFSEIGIGY